MDHRSGIHRINFYSSMNSGSSGPTYQQRNFQSLALHFWCHIDHFIQRRSNQSTQSYNINFIFNRFINYLLGIYHHSQINDLIAITSQHDSYDIFTDIMHIPFNCCQQNFLQGTVLLTFFRQWHEWLKIGYSLFHHSGRLHHLGQKHLAFPKKISNHIHPVH